MGKCQVYMLNKSLIKHHVYLAFACFLRLFLYREILIKIN